MAAAMAPQQAPHVVPAEDNPEEDAPADLRMFQPPKQETAPAAPRRREMVTALVPHEASPADPDEDDSVEEDPVEDDPEEEDPEEDDPVEDDPVEYAPDEEDPSEDDPTGAGRQGPGSRVFYTPRHWPRRYGQSPRDN